MVQLYRAHRGECMGDFVQQRNQKNKNDFEHLMSILERPGKINMFTQHTISRTSVYSKCSIHLRNDREGRLIFSNGRLVDVASNFNSGKGSRICVVNCGNGLKPGAGVQEGSVCAEADVCRCTNLFAGLNSAKVRQKFYEEHECSGDPFMSNKVVYSPKVIQIKSDDFASDFLPHWFIMDVATFAAPMKDTRFEYDPLAIKNTLIARLLMVFKIAQKHNIDVIVMNDLSYKVYGYERDIVLDTLRCICKLYRNAFSDVVIAIEDYDDFVFFKENMESGQENA